MFNAKEINFMHEERDFDHKNSIEQGFTTHNHHVYELLSLDDE